MIITTIIHMDDILYVRRTMIILGVNEILVRPCTWNIMDSEQRNNAINYLFELKGTYI